MGFSLPKSKRILNRCEFARVFKLKKRYGFKCFTILVRENQVPYARIGFSLGKKHIKTATKRNYIRRLFRERFRHSTALQNLDIVILSNSPLNHLKAEELKQECDWVWKAFLKRLSK